MPYTPAYLIVKVEALGAAWFFQAVDKALLRLVPMALAQQDEHVNTDQLSPDQLAALIDIWREGLVGWEGVKDPTPEKAGAPLPFTPRHAALIPTEDKLAVVAAFISKIEELQAKKAASAEPPIPSMLPGDE